MKRFISVAIIGVFIITLIGCGHKNTSTEQSVITDTESIIKDLEDGQKYLAGGGVQYGTYTNKINDEIRDIGKITTIGDMKVDKEISESDKLYYEYVAYTGISDATLSLNNDPNVWSDSTKKIKDILTQYKKNISTRN